MIQRWGWAAVTCLALSVAWPVPSTAQEAANGQTLADIRQELSVLFIDLQRLKQELSTTGAPSGVSGDTVLDRAQAIETQLQRLTAKTEELEFRVDRIVQDGTNRIGDLEFRLCELEEGCDIAALGDTPSLGGVDVEPTPVAPTPDVSGLTVNENADFARAQDALTSGDYRSASDQFAAFVTTYPGGPLTIDAQYYLGQAHEGLGEMRAAARAYLDAFSTDPVGPRAPDALLRLGTSLAALGQTPEACVTLGEVGARFPGGEAATAAAGERSRLACE
ncbi:MAG: tol-pal system protein YbgF [Pseudomonadota bacterium]